MSGHHDAHRGRGGDHPTGCVTSTTTASPCHQPCPLQTPSVFLPPQVARRATLSLERLASQGHGRDGGTRARVLTRALDPATIDLVRIGSRVRAGFAPLACVAGGLLVIGCSGDTKAVSQLSGTDRAHRAEFVLTGNTLTVTLASGSGVVGLAGQSVRANCVSQRAHNSGVARTLDWRPRSRRLRVRFSAKVGAAPVFCSIDTASLIDRSYHVEAVLT